jgi:hypothetical protein
MHNAPLSFLIYLRYFKNSRLLNRCELDPCVYEVFDSESALELNPEVVHLTPGTLCRKPAFSKTFRDTCRAMEHDKRDTPYFFSCVRNSFHLNKC